MQKNKGASGLAVRLWKAGPDALPVPLDFLVAARPKAAALYVGLAQDPAALAAVRASPYLQPPRATRYGSTQAGKPRVAYQAIRRVLFHTFAQ